MIEQAHHPQVQSTQKATTLDWGTSESDDWGTSESDDWGAGDSNDWGSTCQGEEVSDTIPESFVASKTVAVEAASAESPPVMDINDLINSVIGLSLNSKQSSDYVYDSSYIMVVDDSIKTSNDSLSAKSREFLQQYESDWEKQERHET